MRVLMCDPLYYEIGWEDKEKNPHMKKDVQPDFAGKLTQWAKLVALYWQAGVDVEFISSASGLGDMVFAANAGWVYNDTFFASHMAPDERKPETSHYAWFMRLKEFNVVYSVVFDLLFEGQSDIITTPEAYLYCHGARNSREVPKMLGQAAELDRPMLTLDLVGTDFYHGDLALFFIRRTKKLLYCPHAFSAKSLGILESLDCDKRAVPPEFACPQTPRDLELNRNFPLNAVDLGSQIIVPWGLPKFCFPRGLYEWLSEDGVEVVFHDFSEFGKSGAGVKCATLVLEE
ncbi:MAG: hypothetical protein HYT22_03310 [Candidatus Niyogibacteria bacterium]|nr:hypothetical protein [Candidatus Niyogibacteria bacterium]